jgi:hypothetical protein
LPALLPVPLYTSLSASFPDLPARKTWLLHAWASRAFPLCCVCPAGPTEPRLAVWRIEVPISPTFKTLFLFLSSSSHSHTLLYSLRFPPSLPTTTRVHILIHDRYLGNLLPGTRSSSSICPLRSFTSTITYTCSTISVGPSSLALPVTAIRSGMLTSHYSAHRPNSSITVIACSNAN